MKKNITPKQYEDLLRKHEADLRESNEFCDETYRYWKNRSDIHETGLKVANDLLNTYKEALKALAEGDISEIYFNSLIDEVTKARRQLQALLHEIRMFQRVPGMEPMHKGISEELAWMTGFVIGQDN